MNRMLAALILALPSLTAAAPSLESISSGGLAAFEATVFPRPSAVPAAALRHPAVTTMTGGFSGAPVELAFDHRDGTITGGVNGYPVELRVDEGSRTVTGGANGAPVKSTFDSTPWKVSYDNGDGLKYTVDWENGLIEDRSDKPFLRLEFDLKNGTLKGAADRSEVDLSFDAKTGRLTGGMNHGKVDMTIVNGDLSDFIRHLFVFFKR